MSEYGPRDAHAIGRRESRTDAKKLQIAIDRMSR